MERAARADEDVAAEVDGGLIWRGSLLVALLLLLRGGLRLRRSDKVAVDHDVLLDDTFSCEDDMPRTEDAGATADLVAGFLVMSLARLVVLVVGGKVGTDSLDVFSTDGRFGRHGYGLAIAMRVIFFRRLDLLRLARKSLKSYS